MTASSRHWALLVVGLGGVSVALANSKVEEINIS